MADTEQDTTERPYRCDDCGAEGVKLWREWQTFAEHAKLRCKTCAELHQGKGPIDLKQTDQIGWLVPAVPVGGTFWGYTSVPDLEAGRWRELPDAPS